MRESLLAVVAYLETEVLPDVSMLDFFLVSLSASCSITSKR